MGASRAFTSSFGMPRSNSGCAVRLLLLLLVLLLLPAWLLLLLLLLPGRLPKDIDCVHAYNRNRIG
jgi:hypothetical protein